MKTAPPAIQEKILEEWHREGATEWQLAERYGLTPDLVREIIDDSQAAQRQPVSRQVMSVARALCGMMPVEVAGSFSGRFEQIAGISAGMLTIPGL